MTKLILHISNLIKEQVKNCIPISGGDISQAYLVETAHHRYFLKVNSDANALHMFEAEQKGLESIANSKTILVPKVFFSGSVGEKAFLLLEYIESKLATGQDFEKLGHQLAKLHKITAVQYGFEHTNFIGSLLQQNKYYENWLDFYIEQRLQPQFQLAVSKKLMSTKEVPNHKMMSETLRELFTNVKPSLLHGDLWNGNFLISTDGVPYLIDPAVYYGHHEVDIAMSKLFGGFDNSFYDAYYEIIPKESQTHTRIEIYQLYYVLVHLNLFGSSYYNSVKRILKIFFN